LADATLARRPDLREHGRDQTLGGVGRLLLLEPVEQFAQGLELLASRRIDREGMVERESLLGGGLSVQHGVHRLGQLPTIHG
jgi:hypothetical protein